MTLEAPGATFSRNDLDQLQRRGITLEDARLTSVPVRTTPAFSAGSPRTLFHARIAPTQQMAHYRLHPDGRILTLAPGETAAVRDAVVVLNWPSLLRN